MPEVGTSDQSGRTLKLRIVSALIAAPLAVAAVFLLPPTSFALVFAALAGIALDEWGRLAGYSTWRGRMVYLLVFGGLCVALAQMPGAAVAALAVMGVGWVIAAGIVVGYPRSAMVLRAPGVIPGAGLLVLTGAWLGLVSLRAQPGLGAWLIIWLFVVVWSADIGAYFVGRAYGRHKLALAVSPGKTWEGAAGGLVCSVLLATGLVGIVPALHMVSLSLTDWALLAFALGAISIVGDLFESVLKRETGAKDSGTLLPGHGGLLDRIDALLAVLPSFALFVLLMLRN
ncbi:MAG: CDP-archaeol synthase [Gammaproteobacteria bacterium]|nr:MAG: CDP-archaeol synthase [Gammaproteobacteria bacterium]